MKVILKLLTIIFLANAARAARGDENWPQWRGPNLDGTSGAKGLPVTWSETENIVWKTPLPAWAGSSPVIWGDRIFLTSPSERVSEPQADEVGRKLPRRYVKVDDSGGRDILLMCFRKNDGKLLWKKTIDSGNKLYGKHNMASPSPVTDGRHVWVLTGTGRLAAYDFTGQRKWKHDLQKEYGEFGLFWGYASSPLLYKDRIIVQVLHGATTKNPSYLVAFDKASGEVAWKVERETDAVAECPDAYTTPTVLHNDGEDEIIVSGADYVTAHDPRTGEEIWRSGGLNPDKRRNYRICGTPVAADGRVFVTSRIKPVLAIKAGGRGDVTKSHILWTYSKGQSPDVPSAAYDGEYLYLIGDRGFATCLNAETGEPVWGPERITGGPYSASPLVADGKLYVTNEDGVTTVLALGPEFKLLQKNELAGGYTLSSFAPSGRRMYLRMGKMLYCIGEKE